MADDAPKGSSTMTLALALLLVAVIAELGWGFFRPAGSLAAPLQMHHGATAETSAHAEH